MSSLSKHLSGSREPSHSIDMLLTPSWLSGALAIVLSLGVVLGSIGLLYYHGSSLHVLVTQQTPPPQPSDYQTINDSISNNNLFSDIPLFVFWAGVGLIIYSIASAIVQGLHSVVELEAEMGYVHANRRDLLKYVLERAGLRLVALGLWVVYLNLTLHLILPYSIALGQAGTAAANWPQGVLLTVFGAFVLAVGLHVHTIFLRLIALRPRLFSN